MICYFINQSIHKKMNIKRTVILFPVKLILKFSFLSYQLLSIHYPYLFMCPFKKKKKSLQLYGYQYLVVNLPSISKRQSDLLCACADRDGEKKRTDQSEKFLLLEKVLHVCLTLTVLTKTLVCLVFVPDGQVSPPSHM